LAVACACALSAPSALAAFPNSPPNDPLFDSSPLPNSTAEQWDLASPGGGFDRGISADRAWRLTTGAGAVIADIDVGVQFEHPDLAGRWLLDAGETGTDARGRDRRSNGVDDDHDGYVDDWRGWDFYGDDNDATSDTSNAHGTNVAGVLGAAADNGIGIAGIAPDSRLLALRTSDNILHQGVRLAEAIVYATDHGADAISMSLGADSFGTVLRRAAAYAHAHGVVIAVASGNEFAAHHHQPQDFKEALAVGGVNADTATIGARDGMLALLGTNFTVHASYADTGAHLDVVAPTQVPTTEWGGGFRRNWDGTSAATPHVTAVAALVKSRAKSLGLALSADETIQIIRGTADDLTDPGQGYRPGWDIVSGYGRVNALRAVERVTARTIPPEVTFSSPEWYAPTRGAVAVRALVHGRTATTWVLELGSGEDPRSWRTIASGAGARRPSDLLATIPPAALGAGSHTLRLRVTDANGNSGEDRVAFTAQRDGSLRRGFPLRLGASGESSPTLADLDGDGAAEIVLATADGLLRVYDGRSGRMRRGFPRRMRTFIHSAPIARRIGAVRAGFLGTPAVGDIAGDRRPEIVATGLDGAVYAWDGRGRTVRGFPHRISLRRPASRGRLDAAILASPALADLDRSPLRRWRGKLDVVFGAADQRVYALRGDGRDLPGWPVLARDGAGGDVAKILSSPAIGDLDGDHSPDIVEGTAEAYGSTPSTTGRVYAWDARGRLLRGWPVKPGALAADSIPIAGEGVPASPALADVDGDGRDEVAVTAFTGEPELYDGSGRRLGGTAQFGHFQVAGRGRGSDASATAAIALGANSAFGRMRRGGALRYYGGLIDARLVAAQLTPSVRIPFEHLLAGWDARTGNYLSGFPRVMEGWEIAAGPALADVDGDGSAEVIAGSSGNVLHAFSERGSEPAGWPKRTGGWLLAAPAVGDVDDDSQLEVAAVTRDGWLFLWDTPAPASSPAPWPSFRHDARNSGRYGG
jgi:hypothetical protein